MRVVVLLSATTLLAACGGGGETVVSTPVPGGGSGGGTTNTQHSFANPTQAKTYTGVGGVHTYEYLTDARECCDQQAEIYSGNTTTIRNSSISISYDPADAVYTLKVTDPLAGASTDTRFQDPASRTDFDGDLQPQWGTPELANQNVQYLQAGDGNPRSPYRISGTGMINPGTNDTPASGVPGSTYQATSLFLLKPGTETQYVTYAGYLRNSFSFDTLLDAEGNTHESITHKLERGAFAFGETTPNNNVPTIGSGSYSGSMLASMIFNPTLDGQDTSGLKNLPSYFQWIEGTANISVDFANSVFDLKLDGMVHAPQIDTFTGPEVSVLKEGATFTAAGKGDINLVNFGGFKGAINSASFANPAGDTRTVNIEGSTVDGAFYGPNGEEVGGGFRIVGGNPDERVDVLGTFVGKK